MTGIRVPQLDERQGDGRQAAELVGREAEVDRIGAFVATARTDDGALLVTGEHGVGKTVLLGAVSKAASAAASRILRAAGIQFEARDEPFWPEPGPAPAPGQGVRASGGPPKSLEGMRSRTLAPSSGKRASRDAAQASTCGPAPVVNR